MHQQKQRPIINHWYMNLTGQLFKVNMLVYDHGAMSKVIVEYIDGARSVVPLRDWECLKLIRHGVDTARIPNRVT